MKRKLIVPVIISALMLTACGSSSENYSSPAINKSMSDSAPTAGASYDSMKSESYSNGGDYYYDEEETPAESASVESNSASSGDEEKTSENTEIKKEMLVYSCNMTVDVLDFKTAVDSFKDNLNEYKAFIETENYTDGGSSGRYVSKDREKWQSYTATVRVPSADYETFCDRTAELGDLRSKNASVENLSREYYDLSATLEIYENKEKRYMELLAGIVDEEYAISVERELTSIQIEISKIKTRMSDISTDVAYSYVYVTINEVKEYVAEPVKTDTFLQRLGNVLIDSADDFLDFLEELLFALIYLFPYIVIIAVIVMIIVKSRRKSKMKKAEKQNIPMPAPTAEAPAGTPDNTNSENVSDTKKEE